MVSPIHIASLTITFCLSVLQLRAESCTTVEGNTICEVKAGETFQLACNDVVPVHWQYPRQEYGPIEYEDSVYGEHEVSYPFPDGSEIKQTWYEEGDNSLVNYYAQLQVISPVYKDTGFYKCVREGGKMLVSTAYYFVNDEEKLLVEDEDPSIYYGFLTKPLTIPCKPTSLDVQVSLKKSSRELRERALDDGQRRMIYDPRIGFRISAAYATDSGAYFCEATRGDKTMSVVYVVNIIDNLYT